MHRQSPVLLRQGRIIQRVLFATTKASQLAISRISLHPPPPPSAMEEEELDLAVILQRRRLNCHATAWGAASKRRRLSKLDAAVQLAAQAFASDGEGKGLVDT